MALEIITAGLQCYRYDIQGRIDTQMSRIHPIHIMCDNIGLILEI